MPILILLGSAAFQVATKPWFVVGVIAWLAVTRFNFNIFMEETRATLVSLWPLWILLGAFLLAKEFIRALGNKQDDKGHK